MYIRFIIINININLKFLFIRRTLIKLNNKIIFNAKKITDEITFGLDDIPKYAIIALKTVIPLSAKINIINKIDMLSNFENRFSIFFINVSPRNINAITIYTKRFI